MKPDSSDTAWSPTWRLPRSRVQLPGGIELSYVDLAGQTGDGSSRQVPMVLLHGLTNDADSWADTVVGLRVAAPGARLVIPDLRGHGASGLPADGSWRTDPESALSIQAFADDVIALLDILDVRSAMLVGHSMGSLVATACALSHPQRVSNVVLVSTSADARATPFLSDWLRVDVFEQTWRPAAEAMGVRWPDEAMALRPIDLDPQAVAWMEKFWNFYPFSPGRSTREVAQRSAHLPLATWIGATQAILDTDNRDALRRTTTDVCALWATQDSFFRHHDQATVIEALTAAAQDHGTGFVWKQYGRRPLADDGLQTDDLGHNLTWDAPEQVAIDIAAVWHSGTPSSTWFRSGAPTRPHTIVEAADAPMVRSGVHQRTGDGSRA